MSDIIVTWLQSDQIRTNRFITTAPFVIKERCI